MLLTDQELHRLQTLARIKLSPEEQIKLGNQISGIISFLDKLKEINNGGTIDKQLINIENPLRTLDGVHAFADTKALLHNVQHEKINNSIVIKSVLA